MTVQGCFGVGAAVWVGGGEIIAPRSRLSELAMRLTISARWLISVPFG